MITYYTERDARDGVAFLHGICLWIYYTTGRETQYNRYIEEAKQTNMAATPTVCLPKVFALFLILPVGFYTIDFDPRSGIYKYPTFRSCIIKIYLVADLV